MKPINAGERKIQQFNRALYLNVPDIAKKVLKWDKGEKVQIIVGEYAMLITKQPTGLKGEEDEA